MKTLLLLSGGLDSTILLAELLKQGRVVETLTFDYGQTHPVEIEKAKHIADVYNVPHTVLILDAQKHKTFDEISQAFVPARNLIFLSHALNYALNNGCDCIVIGVNRTDEQGFPDCRIPFIEAVQQAFNTGSPTHVKIEAPLIDKTKAEIVAQGQQLGVDFSLTNTCYFPENKLACGKCESCLVRLDAFEKNKLRDNVKYAERD